MTSDRINQGRIGTVAPGRSRRLGQAAVLVPLLLLGSILTARGAAAADQFATPLPEPTPTAEASERPLSLGLDRVLDPRERGHSEFDLSLRREIWSDPMVRLAFGIGREEAAARRGGLVGYPVPFTAGSFQAPLPGADLRLVLSGPFAADWHDLSPQEKVGRVAETVVYYGIIFEILRGL
jgi:hypothetical protein